jgi:epoxide hydrolase-like predicted phosphatase
MSRAATGAGTLRLVIEAVIFDYGGVFSSPLFRGIGKFEIDMGYPPGAVLELLFGDKGYIGVEGWGYEADDPKPKPENIEWTHDFHRMEIGELSLDDWFKGLEVRAPEILGQPINMDAYFTFMAEMPVGVHWSVVHRARELLADGVPIALLTNNVKEWGDHWRATFPVDELFEIIVDSSAVGLRKPDPRIYLLTCERLGVAPDTAVFIDDNAENVAAARALGMETVHFGEDPFAAVAELDDILRRRGVKPRR